MSLKKKKKRYYWLEWSLRFTESFWKGRKAFLTLLPCIIDKEKKPTDVKYYVLNHLDAF